MSSSWKKCLASAFVMTLFVGCETKTDGPPAEGAPAPQVTPTKPPEGPNTGTAKPGSMADTKPKD